MGGYYYTTNEGDTWDYIAWKVYGDEYRMPTLTGAEENWQLVVDGNYMFSSGVKVWCPYIEKTKTSSDIPAWRR